MKNTLDLLWIKLKEDKITLKEFIHFRNICMKLINKAGNKYQIRKLINNPLVLDQIRNDVFAIAILKSLKNYNDSKSRFSTYFYYKIMSALRVEIMKYKRRYKLLNTIELPININLTKYSKWYIIYNGKDK